ncbi:MAG TPA: aminotransferase class I/II-fold pyridoxal phosphate-dependent enzyme [Steroidobacteraceae bacterium]|nr:aminotransferase class I/II-fold pyridoxal phosphate-dependent enzyme [Steroidobacteraceae bacterium]
MKPRFAPFVERIAHEAGGDPWALHWEARNALARGEDVIVLSVGDPDLDTPPAVVDAAVTALRAGDTHYTESAGRPRLRAAVAALHTRRTGQPAGAENAIVLGGCQNGLFVASLLLAGPGDEVIALDPMYATYPATIRASGATLVPVEAPAARGFHPDLAALEAAVTPRTRAIFLATPNNPTGVVFSDADVDGIAALARRHGLWIVSDEVYAGIAEGGRVPSLAARLPEQVLTLGSLSKTHAMTGWRAGWIVGPADFVAHAEQLALNMLYGLPGFVQQAAEAALAIAAEAESTVRDYCARRRDLFCRALEDLPGVRACSPDAGMFMLLDVRATGLSAGEFVHRLYRAERVSLLDGAAFGRATEGFVRACFAAEEATLADAAARIRRFCAALAPAR